MTTPMPELPEARQFAEHGIGWFTAGQMQAYARAAIEAATLAAQRQPPEGYQLVPIEPTEAMLAAIWAYKADSLIDAYRALLAAAPRYTLTINIVAVCAHSDGVVA